MSPMIFAIAIFSFDYNFISENQILQLTHLTGSVCGLTAICEAFRLSGDVGYLYYWVFWIVSASFILITLLLFELTGVLQRLQGAFSHAKTQRQGAIVSFAGLFVFFGNHSFYYSTITDFHQWFSPNVFGFLFYSFLFESLCLVSVVPLFWLRLNVVQLLKN